MKRNIHFCYITILIILSSIILSSCKPDNKIFHPNILNGVTRVVGKIINNRIEKNEKIEVTLAIYNPITADPIRFSTYPDQDGNFIFSNIPIESNFATAFIYLTTETNYNTIFIGLASDKNTKLEILYDTIGNINVSMQSEFPLTSFDVIHSADAMGAMIEGFYPSLEEQLPPEDLYKKGYNYFIKYIMQLLHQRLKVIENNSSLSEISKKYLENEYTLFLINTYLFDYNDEMIHNFMLTNPEGNLSNFIAPPSPDKSYYSFLKDLDLNKPHYLYNSEFPKLLQNILSDEVLNIPPIKDKSIEEWLYETKCILENLVGFDQGLFYDVLIGNAYSKQLVENFDSLSEKQKQNIHNYYKGGEIEKILLRKNSEIMKLNSDLGKVVINETPKIDKEKLMESIISKYRGKRIIVNFWATWCAPCLSGMRDFIKSKKEIQKERDDVIFLYITGETSPVKDWEKRIKNIDGEHYYVTNEEWEFFLEYFETNSIPTYLFYDAHGILIYKKLAYPGAIEMEYLIEEL